MNGRFLGWLGVAVLTATVVATAPAARADTAAGATLVVLGDSFASNMPQLSGTSDCSNEASSWPNQLASLIGIAGTDDFVDQSCAGGTLNPRRGWPIAKQASLAAAQGAFGPATRAVFIQAGMNDQWGTSPVDMQDALERCVFDIVQGCGLEASSQGRLPDYEGVTGASYAERLEPVVTYVRYYAPNARIVLLGYPEIVGSGDGSFCIDVLGTSWIQPNAAGLARYLDRLESARAEAVETLGVEGFSVRELSAGHGLCTPDPWVNGIGSPAADFLGFPLHPSSEANAVLAATLREQFGL